MQLSHNPDLDPKTHTARERARMKIAQQTAEFFSRGGKVEKVDSSVMLSNKDQIRTSKRIPESAKKRILKNLED